MNNNVKYFIAVASLDHIEEGVKESISQVCHGKKNRLALMSKGDWLIYYANVKTFQQKDTLQEFSAIGKVIDDEIYQVGISEDFKPHRRRIRYVESARAVSIKSLIDKLDFIVDKKHYGYQFRYGLLEISKKDFFLIAREMNILVKKNN